MTLLEALELTLAAYTRYYDIERETPIKPFAAEATAHIHDQQYVLVKKAKVTESYSNEFVYFALTDCLTEENLEEYVNTAWEDGMSKVDPIPNHRSSDVTVFMIAERVEEAAEKAIKKNNKQISYAFGFRGYSNLRLLAHDISTGRTVTNRRGSELKKVVTNIK